MVIFIFILLRRVCWGFNVTYTSSEAVFVRAVILCVNPGLANFSCYSFPFKNENKLIKVKTVKKDMILLRIAIEI